MTHHTRTVAGIHHFLFILILFNELIGRHERLLVFIESTEEFPCRFILKMHQPVRRYIGRRLSEYYAQPADRVVGKSSGAASANLSSLLGEWHWRRLLRRFYEEREGHWLTPVELFQPHFSHALGDFCCRAVDTRVDGHLHQLEIVELGGGQGTNANLILSYLQEHKPKVYQGLSYTLVDSSPSLHRLQKQVLNDSGHADRVNFQLVDLMDVAERSVQLLKPSNVPTVVLAMEVLDNLPHDKVRAKSRKQLQQAEIHVNGNNGVEQEIFVPLKDPLLARAIKTVPSFVKSYPTWIPSVACGIMEHLIHQRPNLGLAFADFDWLPAPDLLETDHLRLTAWGEGEPIITDMEGIDHECFLQAPPHCDILFPTDFEKLGSFTKRTISSRRRDDDASSPQVQVEKQADFLERYGSEHVQKTKSWLTGHTPLLHDFANCSVLTIVTPSKHDAEQSRVSR